MSAILEPKIASVMSCPKCGGSEVRPSSHAKWMDRLRAPLGQRAFRCRKCRFRFYTSPGPAPAAEAAAAKHTKRSRQPEGKRGRKRLRRWIVEAIIFAVLLLLFWFFLRYLTREQPASSGASHRSPGAGLSKV
jgi:hypothetical protein